MSAPALSITTHTPLKLVTGGGTEVTARAITHGQALVSPLPRLRSVRFFTPTPEMVAIQTAGTRADADLIESSLYERMNLAMSERGYSASQRQAVFTTCRRACAMDDTYHIEPEGQLRYTITGGRRPYTYDYATDTCTCEMHMANHVCLHSIWAYNKITEAMRLAGGQG